MRRLRAGLIIGAVGAVLLPGVAAAQCEGGATLGGYYLSTGGYVSGGCSHTNPTTTGQLHPSGAQVVPSTNPAAGITRLPGQPVPASPQPTVLDTVTGSYGPLGPMTSTGAYATTAGPGARVAPGYPSDGPIVAVPGTMDATATARVSGAGAPSVTISNLTSGPTAGNLGAVSALGGVGVLSTLPGQTANNPSPAYSVTLPVAPAVSAAASVGSGSANPEAPLPPGRGGPTYVGE